jgi:hypothetical protein
VSTFLFYLIFDIISIYFLYAGSVYKKIGNKKYILFFLFSFLLLFILVAFRSNQVGTDYEFVGDAYSRVVNGTQTDSDISWFGLPLFLICKGIGFFCGNNIFAFYFILAFFSLFFLYKAILKNSSNPAISLFLMISFCLYYQMFNQSRQMLAIVIVLYSYTYLKERKFWKYFLTIFLAFMIHNSALVMLPVYFLFPIKVDKKVLWFYILSSIALFLSFDLIEAIIRLTSYSKYIDSIYNVAFSKTTILNTILRASFFLFSYFFYSKAKGRIVENKRMVHYAGLCLLIQVASIRFYFLARLTTYFFIFYLFIFADIYQYIKEKLKENKRKCSSFCILFFVLFFLYHTVYYFSSSGATGCGYQEYTFISFKGK